MGLLLIKENMMKKILVLLVLIALLVSCNASIKMLDEDGFEIFQCGWSLNENDILIQSHEGFIIDDIYYTEHISSDSVTVKNPLSHVIKVRFTYNQTEEWICIDALSEVTIGATT